MVKNGFSFGFFGIVAILILTSCGQDTLVTENKNLQEDGLILVANGEDFIRQGFVSKDGWQLNFNHAFVTLDQVTAYQTDPPFDAEGKDSLMAKKSVVLLNQARTIDLAEGDENAPPITVGEAIAPLGIYNALSWKLVKDPQTNASIILDGRAVKDKKTVNFVLNLAMPLEYECGEFVGEERKGILEAGKKAQLETTFHFDHLFGDGKVSPNEEINLGAIGFEPLARLANNGELKIDLATLESKLSPDDYKKLKQNLESLGHVGEGHCRLVN